MKVLQLNTNTRGGAFHFMARLHLALCECGVDSSAVTRTAPVKLPERALRRFQAWLTEDSKNVFSPIVNYSTTPLGKLSGTTPDIVHLHWVSRWLDLPSFTASLPAETPIFITPHDLGIFTGGCHLHSGCEGFAHGCTHCPVVKAPFDNRYPLPAREHARKRRAFENRNITVVGNSHWTTGYARRSGVFPEATRFETVHPGLDFAQFNHTPENTFGLDPNRPVIGFGSAALSDENKRFPLFLEAAARVAQKVPGLQLLVFGDHHALPPEPEGTTLHHIGPLDECDRNRRCLQCDGRLLCHVPHRDFRPSIRGSPSLRHPGSGLRCRRPPRDPLP